MGIIWFDYDLVFTGHRDWRLSDADGTLGAYAELLDDPRFAGTLDPASGGALMASSGASTEAALRVGARVDLGSR